MIQNLKNFKLDQEKKNSLDNIKDLKNFVDNFFLQNDLKQFVYDTARLLDLDQNVVSLKSKKLLIQKFIYKENKFDETFSFFKIIYQLIIFFVIYIKILLSKNQKKTLKKDLILFNVDSIDEIEKFKKVLLACGDTLILTKKKFNFNNVSNHIFDSYLKKNLIINYNNEYLDISFKDKNEKYSIKTNIFYENNISLDRNSVKKKLCVFNYAVKLFLKSIFLKFNLLEIFNIILFSKIKNYSIFKKFKAKYSLQDRINYTCPIKNFLFKKTGGIISGCVQTHLAEASISLFNDIDLFMTFGDEQYSKILSTSLGSRIEKSVPVGSIRVESFLNKTSREFNYDQEIDILVFGVNIYNWLYLNNESKKNYYMFLNYVSSISKNYKDLKIVFKHHPNNIEDKKEIEIMKSSNVIYLDKKINSYSLIKNSKLFLSYSSTMIIETSGIVGKSYFIDPYNSNNIFFNENINYEKIKLVKPSDIDETINSIILKKDKPKKMLNNICLESKNVSELIVKNLKGL